MARPPKTVPAKGSRGRITTTMTRNPVKFPEGVVAFSGFSAEIRNVPDLPYDIDLEAELQGGRYVTTSLRLMAKPGGPPVTSTDLRALKIASALRSALQDGGSAAATFSPATRKLLDTEFANRDVSEDLLRAVAAVHRMATLLDMPPVDTVARQFNRPPPTAGRWISEAYRQGILRRET